MKYINIKKVIFSLLLVPFSMLYAGEGMWIPGYLSQQTIQWMKDLGVEMPSSLIYNESTPSMKDAIINFGGFCSGVVVSDEGLIFTNHHCGFEAIQQHSSIDNNYLKDGFVAKTREEELPNPDLFVSFLIRTENVTDRILEALSSDMSEADRSMVVDSMIVTIQEENYLKDSLLRYTVTSYYEGNEFYLATYKDYTDIRLVYAPPSSVGKFGGDTDNWVWPRHTGDFSLFRIYAGTDNQPASYSSSNVPYRPDYVIPISLEGYQQGSFAMTLGYPGSTNRYLSSFGVKERRDANNAAMINVRGIKQGIWKEAMESNDSIRIKYALKYAVSSNYWKNSIGMNAAIDRLEVIEKKQQVERDLTEWIRQNPDERRNYLQLLTNLELNYRNRHEMARAFALFSEVFFNSSELITLAFSLLNFDIAGDSANVAKEIRTIVDTYANMDLSIDREVFTTLLEYYKEQVSEEFLPEFYETIRTEYKDDYAGFANYLYSSSQLVSPTALQGIQIEDGSTEFFEDPAIKIALDVLVKLYEFNADLYESTTNIEENERLLNAAMREMQEDKNFYPDANMTMRMSIGIVDGYKVANAVSYEYYTTTKGIFEKVKQYKGDSDFEVQPELLAVLAEKDFGEFANPSGEMNVCFITDNDITGGNSGSGIFDARGRLIGLAFDGNWEAMSGDLIFEPNYQRCIGVDIRYALYIMEKYSNAVHLLEELNVRETEY